MEVCRKTCVFTKLADGSVQLLIYKGDAKISDPLYLMASVNLATADVTDMNTTVNGGSTGATTTYVYPQRTATGAAGDPQISES